MANADGSLTVPADQVPVLVAALGDAVAFRTDSGEGAEDDEDQALADGYEALVTALGVTIAH